VKIIQNERYIKSRGRIGRYTFFGGFGILIIGLVVSLNTQRVDLFPISFACLILGFILTQSGSYYMRRFDRGELPHLTLAKALKGFDDRYVLVNYATPASHVLLTPDDVHVLIPKSQAGRISFQDGKWRNPTGLRRLVTWASEEGLGNPTRDAAASVARMQRYLARQLPDASIEVQPLVVFLNPKAEVDASTAPVPAVHVKKLKDYLRARPKGSLTREAQTALRRLLEPASAA
jgi:hypothetical protein